MFKEITKDNWLLFAQHHYDNPTLQKEQEFYDDIKRFKYLKRLFRKYKITNIKKIRLNQSYYCITKCFYVVDGSSLYYYIKLKKLLSQ